MWPFKKKVKTEKKVWFHEQTSYFSTRNDIIMDGTDKFYYTTIDGKISLNSISRNKEVAQQFYDKVQETDKRKKPLYCACTQVLAQKTVTI